MAGSPNPGWRAMAARGYADLSPPEAEHAFLELPTNRAEYVGVLQEIGEYPARSPIDQRVPSEEEVAALTKQRGRWRAVVSLDDERALRNAAWLFQCVFVLDPFYDIGALLYAAWHDPLIRDEHSRRLAEQTAMLVRAAPLLNAGTAVLAPDHLPGSWNPRPGWRKPRSNDDERQVAGWSMRSSLVLLYWADRLDAVVCATRHDVIRALELALGPEATSAGLALHELMATEEAQLNRNAHAVELGRIWARARTVSRRRGRRCADDVACVVGGESDGATPWRVMLGEPTVPDPAMLLRRVLAGQDPAREPALPRTRLKRRPLCLVPV